MNTITLTNAQMAALTAGKPITIQPPTKPTQWEPKDGGYFVTVTGEVREQATFKPCAAFGTERPTRKQAESARDAMCIFNRLLAYRDEFDPNFTFVQDCRNYAVQLSLLTNTYCAIWSSDYIFVGVVYMSKQVAETLARKLNSGEVVL